MSVGRSPKFTLVEALLAVAVLQFVGCTVGPKYHRPRSRDSPRL